MRLNVRELLRVPGASQPFDFTMDLSGLDFYGSRPLTGPVRAAGTVRNMAGALLLGGPDGMDLREFSCGATVWDAQRRRLRRPVEAVCAAWLCAAADAGGGFVDFELRGVLKT